jgi:hypothetical protein
MTSEVLGVLLITSEVLGLLLKTFKVLGLLYALRVYPYRYSIGYPRYSQGYATYCTGYLNSYAQVIQGLWITYWQGYELCTGKVLYKS